MSTPSIQQLKNDIRRENLRRRKQLTDDQLRSISDRIAERLLSLPEFKEAHTVHCYIDIPDKKEVQTRRLIERIAGMGKTVVAPRIIPETRELEHVPIDGLHGLRRNHWGVDEPVGSATVGPDDLDFVVVPMTGGDPYCNRMGYGRGFYDQFLSKVQAAVKAGLLPENCMQEETLPVEEHDQKLDYILTESNIYRCSP